MSVTCPCCKAVNETGPQCRRCKADLKLLFDYAEQQRHDAVEAALAGDYETAFVMFTQVK